MMLVHLFDEWLYTTGGAYQLFRSGSNLKPESRKVQTAGSELVWS